MASSDLHRHPYGEAVRIINFQENRKFEINYEALNTIFLHEKIADRKVAIFSIIGAFRRGKSYFLNYCLRFLYANYASVNNPILRTSSDKHWMGSRDDPLTGFSWRGGSVRDTTGIIMWSDVFLHTDPKTGDEIAIVVMDTQGLFDDETTADDNSRIFALSCLFSSMQVLNLQSQIQEDHLEYLQFATAFADFVSSSERGADTKPFQNLLFLIRDCDFSDYQLGSEGGNEYLEKILNVKKSRKPELIAVRKSIKKSFEESSCCLLPHPGDSVTRGKNFDGRWGPMNDNFRTELKVIIEKLLKSENLIMKKLNTCYLTGSDVKALMDTYFKLFQSDKVPTNQTIYDSLVEKQMQFIIEKCVHAYKKNIEMKKDLITEETVDLIHKHARNVALLMFKNEKKIGGEEEERKFTFVLVRLMEDHYNEWKSSAMHFLGKLNEHKKDSKETKKAMAKIEKELEDQNEKLLKINDFGGFEMIGRGFGKVIDDTAKFTGSIFSKLKFW